MGKNITPEFENLDSLLSKIRLNSHTRLLQSGCFIRQGEYYDKSLLSALGDPIIIKPSHLRGYRTEPKCEIYTVNYGENETFIAVLPLRKNEKGRDSRESIYLIKNDFVDYFLSAKIGYSGYEEMTFPDQLSVLKSIEQFPTTGFEEMAPDEVIQEAKKIDFHLFTENYSCEDGMNDFSGWKRQFNNVAVTQIKADDGWTDNKFNPMYFLAIHRDE